MSDLEWPHPSPSPLPQCDYSEWGATWLLIPAVYLLAFVAGTVGNGLVLWVYLARGRRRTDTCSEWRQEPCGSTRGSVTEWLIASLAVADLAFVTTLPLWAVYAALGYHWPFGAGLCRASSYLVALNMYASVFSLTGLSMERYRVIARGRNPGRTAHGARRAVAAVWTAACILALPALLLRTVREERLEGGADDEWQEGEGRAPQRWCDMDYSTLVSAELDPEAREQAELLWAAVLGLKSTLLGFLLPLAVLLLCYCSLGRLLSQHFCLGPRPDHALQRRLLLLISALVLAFFLCWLPFHANKSLSMLVELGFLPYSCTFDQWLVGVHPYAICLGYANSCLNPLLYGFCDPAFRRHCRGVVRGICTRQRTQPIEGRREPHSKSSALQSVAKRETVQEEVPDKDRETVEGEVRGRETAEEAL